MCKAIKSRRDQGTAVLRDSSLRDVRGTGCMVSTCTGPAIAGFPILCPASYQVRAVRQSVCAIIREANMFKLHNNLGAVLLISFAGGAFIGCQQRGTAPEVQSDCPEVMLSIPNDIPETMVLLDKGGNPHVEKAREVYARAFRQGWEEYCRRFRNKQLELEDDSAEPALVQEYVLSQRGRIDGFRACRAALVKRR